MNALRTCWISRIVSRWFTWVEFGLISSTLLLTLGTSAAVHAAEIGTTLASGASQWYRENIDSDILIRLVIPGGIRAFTGAVFQI